MRTLRFYVLLSILSLCGYLLPSVSAPVTNLYEMDFTAVDVGGLPSDFLVIEGEFAVRQDKTNRYLELPGTPLDTFCVLFGPAFIPKTGTGLLASARIYGTSQGRRYPALGIGVCGVSGYRLQVTPSKKRLELYHGERVVADQPFDWSNNSWTHLALQIAKAGDQWRLEGSAWSDASPRPTLVTYEAKEDPTPGRCALWGIPYSGKPLRFDDLKIGRAGAQSATAVPP